MELYGILCFLQPVAEPDKIICANVHEFGRLFRSRFAEEGQRLVDVHCLQPRKVGYSNFGSSTQQGELVDAETPRMTAADRVLRLEAVDTKRLLSSERRRAK